MFGDYTFLKLLTEPPDANELMCWTVSPLVQVKYPYECRLSWSPKYELQLNLYKRRFIQSKAFQNIVCQTSFILYGANILKI